MARIDRSTDFEWLAHRYVEERGGQERIAQIVTLLDAYLPRSGVILDVGVGPGQIAASLTNTDRRVIGVDISAAMAAFARDALGSNALRADAQSLPLPNGSIDAVMMIWVLNHVANPSAAIIEAARVLNPGGRLLFLSGIPRHPNWDTVGLIISALDVLRQGQILWEDSLESVGKLCGLAVIHHDTYVTRFRQRPSGLAHRIATRSYGHLRDLDPATWCNNVEPVIHALNHLSTLPEYRSRENQHPFLVLEKSRKKAAVPNAR